MKKELLTLTLILLMLSSACVPQVKTKGSHIRLVKPIVQKRTIVPADVAVFYKKQPDFDFTEIGIVEGVAIGSKAGLQDLIPELQRQATAIGATGIYKIEIQRNNQAEDTLYATAVAIVKNTE